MQQMELPPDFQILLFSSYLPGQFSWQNYAESTLSLADERKISSEAADPQTVSRPLAFQKLEHYRQTDSLFVCFVVLYE